MFYLLPCGCCLVIPDLPNTLVQLKLKYTRRLYNKTISASSERASFAISAIILASLHTE
jgi:hypothetical protein